MRLQLTVFSIFLLILLSLHKAGKISGSRNITSPAGQGKDANSLGGITVIIQDALLSYIPFATVALLMLSYGKPGLFPQWAGWGCVILQMGKSLALYFDFSILRKTAGWLILACLFYLWILQLPYFDPIPA